MNIYINMRQPHVKPNVLGPFERYCLWVSGCNRHCPGCISPESHDMYAGTQLDTGALAWEIIASGTEGITISGGEPFLQAPALCQLLQTIKRHRDMGVIIYTGFLLEEITSLEGGAELLALCDLLIDGPYIRQLDDGKSLRGSSNQRVIPLTQRYRPYLGLYGTGPRQVQIFHELPQEIHRVGIPTGSSYTETNKST